LTWRGLIVLFFVAPGLAAAEQLEICYNWGCAARATVTLSDFHFDLLQRLFAGVDDAGEERAAIAFAIGLLQELSGEQTPTWADRAGNSRDAEVDGRMDCIDHASNATTYLRLLERRALLRFHSVLEPIVRARWIFSVHWAARILDQTTGEAYAVDSWYFDNGRPAAVIQLDDWRKGRAPDG
jgi:hypothetical protein